jgi:protein Mpv17
MPSITSVTIQSAILKVAANLTAQTLTQWNTPSTLEYDWTRVAEFAAFGIVSAPIVSVWQRLLERNFPSQQKSFPQAKSNGSPKPTAEVEAPTKHLSWGNILIKLLLDQTIGQFIINTTFLVCTNGARIESWTDLLELIQSRIFLIIWASWKLWPWVALVNFIWVPVQWRVLVGALVGFGWNIFLSIWSMRTGK